MPKVKAIRFSIPTMPHYDAIDIHVSKDGMFKAEIIQEVMVPATGKINGVIKGVELIKVEKQVLDIISEYISLNSTYEPLIAVSLGIKGMFNKNESGKDLTSPGKVGHMHAISESKGELTYNFTPMLRKVCGQQTSYWRFTDYNEELHRNKNYIIGTDNNKYIVNEYFAHTGYNTNPIPYTKENIKALIFLNEKIRELSEMLFRIFNSDQYPSILTKVAIKSVFDAILTKDNNTILEALTELTTISN